MGDPSCVGEARRHATRLATEMEFGEVDAGRVALVVTELGTNLVKHARSGRLLIATRQHGEDLRELEILSLDEGPGIANMERSMSDGFSTAGSPGTGLGALRRLADDFDIHSSVPGGTVAIARVRPRNRNSERSVMFRLGVVALCAPGETVCGDGWVFASEASKAAVMLADGLGHGPDAYEAAQAAVRQFCRSPFSTLTKMIEESHAVLRATRGAALSVARLDSGDASIRSVGAGNVIMRVISGVADRTLLSQFGTVGVQIRKPEEVTIEWPRHAMLVAHSDGIQARWPARQVTALLGRDPGLVAGLLVRDFCRGNDDATVVVIRRKE
jgi:anti-sigma regulatory factor (Ser/Thr protein kinase)